MNFETITCTLLLTAAVSALVLARKRRLRNTNYFLPRLHGGTLTGVQDLITDLLAIEDEEAYENSGGFTGLRKRSKNAALLVGFLQALVHEGHVPEISVQYIAPKAFTVRLYTLAAYIEAVVRFVVPKIPHIAAKMALLLYADLEASIRAVLSAEYPDGMDDLNAVL